MGFEAELRKLELHVSKENYAGHCKFDALNSPWLDAFFGFSPWTRRWITRTLNEIPLPLRSVLGVKRSRNPETIACFIQGYCYWYGVGGESTYLSKAIELGNWLLENDSASKRGFSGSGLAWGYPFPWQNPGFYAPRHTPNCTVSVFCGEAFLDLYRLTSNKKYLDAARKVARFVLEDLPTLEETPYTLCKGYVPTGVNWSVIHINALAAGFLAKLSRAAQDPSFLDAARKMIQWVVSVKSPDHSWNYTYPKAQSGMGPDSAHTGLILNGIWDYIEVTSEKRLQKDYFPALNFYKECFFENGAAKARANRTFPVEARAAAQGILTFSRASAWKPEFSEEVRQIAEWTFDNLFDTERGRFYYQKRRFLTWKLDLMRSSNSWMFQALTRWQMDSMQSQRKAA